MDDNAPFIDSLPPRPKGGNFYPEDMTIEEFNDWKKSLSKDDLEKAEGFYHSIIRKDNKLTIVPYSEMYKDKLMIAKSYMYKAAEYCENTSLKRFLISRADAFLTNEYQESEIHWMEIDPNCNIDVTIGPYEVYRDELFNYKASFECFIGIKDFDETMKLKIFEEHLQKVEDNLPIDDKYKNPAVGTSSNIIVIDQVFSSGDVGGPQTSAFNLPNDEKVVAMKGSKMVMLKNVQEKKFEHIMKPISEILIHPSQQKYVSFDAFFSHILCHEIVHGIGPHNIKDQHGNDTTVRKELQELHSALEEAKADITGLLALQQFVDWKVIEVENEESFYVTFLACAFRSIRFGLEEAHGKGQALQLTYLIDQKAVLYHEDNGTFSIDFNKIKNAVKNLTTIIMTIQATGNKKEAQELLDKYGINLPIVSDALSRISHVPIDIQPSFPIEDILKDID